MECYNCGAALSAAARCEKCGADVKVYKRILAVSNRYYNEGLERAGVRNLTGAIDSLKKSLRLNKMNTDARNLLGLVYFEMGETVAALSEWVISKNFQENDNAAGRYLSEIQTNPSRLDTINQTIKKYNQALAYCRQDSRDLAVIQLKKVISLNPKLVRGYQLLALLYMQEGKYEQAKKALRNAAQIDENNTTTLRYQKEVKQKLRESGSKKQKKEDLISYQSGNETIIMPANFKDNSTWQTVVNIAIGVGLGVAIALFLLLPNIRQQAKGEANEARKEASDMISTKEQAISALEKQVEDYKKKAEKEQEASEGTQAKFHSYEQLLSAYASYAADDIEAAGAALAEADEQYLSGRAKEIYDEVSAKVNERYLATMYQEGYRAYQTGDYPLAIEKLLKVAEADEQYQNGNAAYYLAQSYRREENVAQALVYYNVVLEHYPGTERAKVAQAFVNANQDGEGADRGGQPEGQPEGQQPEGQQPEGQQPEGQPEGQQPEGQPEGQP